MANAPHMGNAKVTFKQNIHAGTETHPVEYQVSAWLTFNNGWDDNSNRPRPLTDQQQAVVEELHRQIVQSGAQMQITIKQKEGQDSRAWPIAGRLNLFPNKKTTGGGGQQYQSQGGGYQQQQATGGGDEW